MFNYVLIKHKQISFVSNGGKFNLYAVPNGLLFSTPTQPRFSFERMILNMAWSRMTESVGNNENLNDFGTTVF
jgi:hypothetical protein